MPKFLIDESLSFLLSDFLKELGFKAKAVRDVGLKGKSDGEIITWAKKNKYVIVTCDQDFAMIYYLKERGLIGVILLRSRFQGVESFIRILRYLHKEKTLEDKSLSISLVVATEYRIRKFPPQTI